VATPGPPRRRGPPEPLPGCAAFDAPTPSPCACPVMGAAEPRAWAVPLGRCLTGWGRPAYAQRRLRGMKAHTKTGQPLWSDTQALRRGRFQLPAADHVIGKAGQAAASLQAGRARARAPCLQPMRQASRGEAGCEAPALHDAWLRGRRSPGSLTAARRHCPRRHPRRPALPRWRRPARRRVLSRLAQSPRPSASPIPPLPSCLHRARPSGRAVGGWRPGRTP